MHRERPGELLVLALAVVGTIMFLTTYEISGSSQQQDPASQFFQRMWAPDADVRRYALGAETDGEAALR